MIKDDDPKTDDSVDSIIGDFTHGQGLIGGLLACSIFVSFLYLGHDSVADQVGIASVTIISVIWIFRPLWQTIWFWITMTCIAVAHFAVIMVAPWPFDGGGRLAPLMVLDIVATLGLVTLVAKVMRGRSQRD